jgi:hypothetical protein
MKHDRIPILIRAYLLICALLFLSAGAVAQAVPDPAGVWTPLEPQAIVFPDGFEPPEAFDAYVVDLNLLQVLLEGAPSEFSSAPPGGEPVMFMPVPGAGLVEAFVVETQLMEPSLAAQFPEIRTYLFRDPVGGASGHMALGPGGLYLASKASGQLVRIEPVQTASGPVYLSYFDSLRRDGADDAIIVHPPNAHDDQDDHDESVPVAATTRNFSVQNVGVNQLSTGGQLRIYRLAAATTAEFYQARGNNDLSVLFSLIVDVLGANAVFEPDVATRLIIAGASLDVFYDDPNTAPFFNAPPQCSISGNACSSDADCDTDNGETCNIRTTCQLRDDNRNNMIALHNGGIVTHDQYDLSVLFAVSRPGVRGGCAWYVVCLEGNANHKARGMVTAGSGGTGSTSGVLAHEVGHMFGARHTFTGQDGSCTLNEFLVGDSESGYEPGSGTTRMSYRGNCGNDNVDTSADPPADQYFHSRSFDEIVDNVFSGDGSTCGTLVNTNNLPPVVDAGPDHAIPRQTPFMLTPGFFFDQQPLTFNWEQYDRAFVQRPIDTDFVLFFGLPDFGPIIRSVPPGDDPTRTVPNLADLLDGTSQPPLGPNRPGEMLPQVDRELNFRFIARDSQMGGGGVAYDAMHITVEGDPFFLTYPNGGEALLGGCTAVATWQVGGSNSAPVSTSHVDLLFSGDGGFNFSPLVVNTPNDGGQAFTVPCPAANNFTGNARLRAQGVGNIFFDISDDDFQIQSAAPLIEGEATGGEVDGQCEFVATLTATVGDDCGVAAGDVTVQVAETTGNATLGVPVISIAQNGTTLVDVDVSVPVTNLVTSPAEVRFSVSALDNCGLQTNRNFFAPVEDNIPPTLEVALDPDLLWPPNHKMIDIDATVIAEDNCGVVSFVLDSVVSSEPDDTTGDGSFIDDIQGVEPGTADVAFQLRAERAMEGFGRTYTATYTATDGSGNQTTESATVEVPGNQSP